MTTCSLAHEIPPADAGRFESCIFSKIIWRLPIGF